MTAAPYRPVIMTGCKGVLAATLLYALDDAKDGGPYAGSALRWLFSDREDGPFTFLKICEALDLDAGRIRRMVRRRAPGASRLYPLSPRGGVGLQAGADDAAGGAVRAALLHDQAESRG